MIHHEFDWREMYERAIEQLVKREQERDELLETLESIADFTPGYGDVCEIIAKRARAAIAKVRGES